jgi:hypothetical protein
MLDVINTNKGQIRSLGAYVLRDLFPFLFKVSCIHHVVHTHFKICGFILMTFLDNGGY